MAVLNTVSLLTIFPETVGAGVGPNGTSGVSSSAQWVAAESGGTAFQMPHLAETLDVSGIAIEEVSPETARARIFQTQRAQQTLPNTEFPFSCYLTGTGATLSDGSTAQPTALSRMLENALGGVSYTATHTADGGGHTTTLVNVDSVATWSVGDVIAWEDATGRKHPRVITDISTLAVTVEPAWPAAPADDDLIRGGATLFINEDVIADTSSNLGATFSALIQKGANGEAGFEMNNCKAALSSMSFGRNEWPALDFNVSSGRHTDPSAGPAPTLPTASFPGAQIMGPDSSIIIGDAGTTTLGSVCNGAVSVEPGVPVIGRECMVDNLGTTGAVGLYSTQPADTVISIDLFPSNASWYSDKAAQTNKRVLVAKNGTDGNCFAFIAENCEIQTVTYGSGEFASTEPRLRAVERDPESATTALQRSKFKLYLG